MYSIYSRVYCTTVSYSAKFSSTKFSSSTVALIQGITVNGYFFSTIYVRLLNINLYCSNYPLYLSPVRYYIKQISNGVVLVLSPGGVGVNMSASCARDRGIDPRTFLLPFERKARPQPSTKSRISFDFQSPYFNFASSFRINPFKESWYPVPRQNLEICSASACSCNTRQKQAK